jgi:hypothetical protein
MILPVSTIDTRHIKHTPCIPFLSLCRLNDLCAIMSEQRKAVIKNADMSDQMQQDAVDIASKALSEYSIEKVGR